ncbi:hypothetical protein JOM56_003941 [Amanita muscaria]
MSTHRSVRFAPLPDPRRSVSVPSSPVTNRSTFPIETYPPCPPLVPDPLPSKRKPLFSRPFFRKQSSSGSDSPSSSVSLTPTPSLDYSTIKPTTRRLNITAEEILTLGTINLFRSTSRNSRSTGHDLPPTWHAPARHSFISAGDNNRGSKRHFLSNRTSTFDGTSNQRKAVKMLNGRVYGARPTNHFANITSEPDPEFVEWGYGGMGSVRGQHAAGMSGTRWERLHNGDDPSMDDGSGMYWLQKRREAREKAEADKSGNEPIVTTIPGEQSAQSPDPTEDVSSVSQSNPEHVLHAITIPANFQRHHHPHRSISKTGSIGQGGGKEADHSPTTVREVENHAIESGDESESGESGEDDADEDESEDDEPERRTALGAGVEKYTRHKDAEKDTEHDPLSIPTPLAVH